MSEPTIEQVRALLSKATPGPWEYQRAVNYEGFSIAPRGTLPTLGSVERVSGNRINISCHNFPGQTEANAQLIAAAPAIAAFAVAEIERLTAELAEAQARAARAKGLATNLIGEIVRDFSIYRQQSSTEKPADWAKWSKARREEYISSQARVFYMTGCHEAEETVTAFKDALAQAEAGRP